LAVAQHFFRTECGVLAILGPVRKLLAVLTPCAFDCVVVPAAHFAPIRAVLCQVFVAPAVSAHDVQTRAVGGQNVANTVAVFATIHIHHDVVMIARTTPSATHVVCKVTLGFAVLAVFSQEALLGLVAPAVLFVVSRLAARFTGEGSHLSAQRDS
jgi:hypothetical protein